MGGCIGWVIECINEYVCNMFNKKEVYIYNSSKFKIK